MGTSLNTLKAVQTTNASNCSGFLKSVAADVVKQPLPQLTADGLIDHISDGGGGKWVVIGKGKEAGQKASAFAQQGYLVVALLKAGDHVQFKFNPATNQYDIPRPYSHGHVSVVIPGPGREVSTDCLRQHRAGRPERRDQGRVGRLARNRRAERLLLPNRVEVPGPVGLVAPY